MVDSDRPTARLSEFIANLDLRDINPEAVKKIETHLLDTVGVALGGSQTTHARQAVRVIEQFGGRPESSVFVHTLKTTALEAAFANAVMAHGIDFDDGHKFVHPGCAIFPVCLSLAEKEHRSGRDLLLAAISGYEVAIRASLAAGLSHRRLGYHPTGTCNTLGAAAAAAKLMGLDRDGIRSSLGIACSQASGLTQYRFDGSPIKHLHAGLAARNGVLAALLAREGFRGTENALEGKLGFLKVMTRDGGDPRRLTDGLGDRFMIQDTDIKPYPSCRQTHPGVDLILNTAIKNNIIPEDVERIMLYTYEYAYQEWLVATEPPAGTLKAILNTPYAMASALLHRRLTRAEYDETSLKDTRVHELMKKIAIKVDDQLSRQFPEQRGARLVVELKDGRRLTDETTNPLGSVANPVSFDHVVQKFKHLAGDIIGSEQSEAVIRDVVCLDEIEDISMLTEKLTGRLP